MRRLRPLRRRRARPVDLHEPAEPVDPSLLLNRRRPKHHHHLPHGLPHLAHSRAVRAVQNGEQAAPDRADTGRVGGAAARRRGARVGAVLAERERAVCRAGAGDADGGKLCVLLFCV